MKTGDRLGRYVLGEKIGEGAMSEVFASRHPLLERDVAIKVLKKEVCSDQQYVARFLDDARSAHGLNHPNLVRVLDVDDSAAQPFIVMDLVTGQPLDEWRKGQVELPVAVRIIRDVASALAAAHEAGLIHRDVKPSNVLIEKSSGIAKLTDFGAAKREREGADRLTQIGQRIGTPRYMAPEQVEGTQVSARCDLFALGALGYELLAGKPAFEGEGVGAVYHAILFKEPAPLREVRSDVPESLARLIGQLLEKKPEDRPASADDVVMALDRLDQAAAPPESVAAGAASAPDVTVIGTTGQGPASVDPSAADEPPGAGVPPPPASPPRGQRPGRNRPPLVPIAAGLALLLVVLGGGFWLFSGGDEPEPVVAEDAGEPVTPPGEEDAAGAGEPGPVAEDGTGAGEEMAGAGGDEAPDDAGGPPGEEPGPVVAEGPADQPPTTEPPAGAAADGEADAPAGSDEPTLATSLGNQAGGASAAGQEDEPAGGDGAPGAGAPGTGAPGTGESDAPAGEQPAPDTQTAQVPASEPPEVPAGPGGGAAPPACATDQPGCAFVRTIAAEIGALATDTPEILLNKEDGVYLDQEYLVVEVVMPEDLSGYLYLDVYTDNGEVFHLLPEPLREANDLKQGAMIRVGVEADERATGVRHWQIAGPFGTGWLVALVAENRLFDGLRPIGETIEAYRPVLLDALGDPTLGRTSYSAVPVEFRPR